MIGQLMRRGWRFYSLFAACGLLALSLAQPRLPLQRAVYRYLFVIDITQSMNARDYHLEGMPADRLGFVKAAIREALQDLPCGSEAGLGLFTTQNSQILLEPLEVCEHLPVLADVLEHIDWRMAWSASSFIPQGLYNGIREIAERDAAIRLAFFTDGQQFPPQADIPPFQGQAGQVRGLIVGVGGAQPVPVPRLDRENRPLGYWEYVDLKDYLPPSETAALDGDSNYYLSRLDETNLRELASLTGLGYHRLQTPAGLSAALQAEALAEQRTVAADAGWMLALLALLLLLLNHLDWSVVGKRRRRQP